MAGIWIFAEEKEGGFRRVIFEMLGEGRKLANKIGQELWAVLIGKDCGNLAQTLIQHGADKVLIVDNDQLQQYVSSLHSAVMAELVHTYQPEYIFFANSINGRDLAPTLAEKLDAGLITDVTGISYDQEVIFERPIYAGKALQQLSFNNDSGAKTNLVTLRPKAFAPAELQPEAKGEIVMAEIDIEKIAISQRIKEVLTKASGRVDLTEADVVISGGRGMKGPENFRILEEIADLVKGAVGASRAAVDEGWWDHQYQVGQTGKVVSPQLYIACGISGAIQHLAGMSSAKCIVAINKDPEAEIFKVADYGIVGDVFQVLPLFKEELAKLIAAN